MSVGGDRDEQCEDDFAKVYTAHAPELRRFALYLCGRTGLADDLVGEAFVRVWIARDRINISTVRGYLFTIVRNLYLTQLRRERRNAPLDETMADDRPGPEARLDDHDALRSALAALARLPEIDRAAVLMRAMGGLAYEEVAAALGISTAAARVKVHRARLKLATAGHAGRNAERPRGRRS